MKKKQAYTHPMNLYPQRIKEEGIVVFDDVRGLPSGDESFVSADYVICIGHKGHIRLMYDDIADYSEQHTVGVIFPNHRLLKVDRSDDYRATLIVVSASLLNDPLLQIINQLRYRYEPHPNVKLNKHEYKMITSVVEGMREITRLQLPDHRMLMTRLLEFLLRLYEAFLRVAARKQFVGTRELDAIVASTAMQVSMPKRPVCPPSISVPLSNKRQGTPLPIGFATKSWSRRRC